MINTIELSKLTATFIDGIDTGEKHFYAFLLANTKEESGFITSQGWFSVYTYTVYYKDADQILIQTMDFTKEANNPVSKYIKVIAKENLLEGRIAIYIDDTLINASIGDDAFELMISVTFSQMEDDKEKLYSLIINYDSKIPNSVALGLFDKPKTIECINKMINIIKQDRG